jgi:hypothetical protein
MSERREAQDACASGAKRRPEGRVRERLTAPDTRSHRRK